MNWKKSLSFLLILVLTFSLTACSGKKSDETTSPVVTTEEEEPTAEATPTPVVEYAPPVVDLEGYTFVVADVNPNRWNPEEGSSDTANAILARNKWVEETYNCKIEYRNHNADEFATAVMSGDKYADIIVCPTWEIGRHINSKRIMDINEVPNIDLTQSYWTDYNNVNLLSYDGRTYGVGAPFASQSDEVFVMFFNKAIIEELGLESPYDLVEKNEWTFDKFLEYEKAASKDLNGDGVMDYNDRFGFAAGHDWDVSVVLYLASGNTIMKQDGDKLSYGVNTPEAFEAINQIKDMVKLGDTFYPKKEGSEMDAYVKAFVDGKALFYTYSRGRGVADPIYEMKDDFGIVPIPRGNNTDTYKCWVSHDAPSLAVPVTNPDIEKTGIVLEALAYASQAENQIAFDEFAATKLRDDESVVMLEQMNQYATSDLTFIGQQMVGAIYGGLAVIPDVCFFDPSLEIASKVAEIEESVQIGMDEFIQRINGTFIEPTPAATVEETEEE